MQASFIGTVPFTQFPVETKPPRKAFPTACGCTAELVRVGAQCSRRVQIRYERKFPWQLQLQIEDLSLPLVSVCPNRNLSLYYYNLCKYRRRVRKITILKKAHQVHCSRGSPLVACTGGCGGFYNLCVEFCLGKSRIGQLAGAPHRQPLVVSTVYQRCGAQGESGQGTPENGSSSGQRPFMMARGKAPGKRSTHVLCTILCFIIIIYQARPISTHPVVAFKVVWLLHKISLDVSATFILLKLLSRWFLNDAFYFILFCISWNCSLTKPPASMQSHVNEHGIGHQARLIFVPSQGQREKRMKGGRMHLVNAFFLLPSGVFTRQSWNMAISTAVGTQRTCRRFWTVCCVVFMLERVPSSSTWEAENTFSGHWSLRIDLEKVESADEIRTLTATTERFANVLCHLLETETIFASGLWLSWAFSLWLWLGYWTENRLLFSVFKFWDSGNVWWKVRACLRRLASFCAHCPNSVNHVTGWKLGPAAAAAAAFYGVWNRRFSISPATTTCKVPTYCAFGTLCWETPYSPVNRLFVCPGYWGRCLGGELTRQAFFLLPPRSVVRVTRGRKRIGYPPLTTRGLQAILSLSDIPCLMTLHFRILAADMLTRGASTLWSAKQTAFPLYHHLTHVKNRTSLPLVGILLLLQGNRILMREKKVPRRRYGSLLVSSQPREKTPGSSRHRLRQLLRKSEPAVVTRRTLCQTWLQPPRKLRRRPPKAPPKGLLALVSYEDGRRRASAVNPPNKEMPSIFPQQGGSSSSSSRRILLNSYLKEAFRWRPPAIRQPTQHPADLALVLSLLVRPKLGLLIRRNFLVMCPAWPSVQSRLQRLSSTQLLLPHKLCSR
eukprot:284816871_2